MRTALHRCLIALLTVAILVLGVASANASRGIALSSTSATSTGTLTFTTSAGTFTCTASISTTMASSIAKTVGATVGSLTRGTLTSCRGLGVTTGSFNGPSAINYTSFTGTLPNITSIDTSTPALDVTINSSLAGTCAYRGIKRWKKAFIYAAYLAWELWEWYNDDEQRRVSGGALCPTGVRISGTLSVGTVVRVSLI